LLKDVSELRGQNAGLKERLRQHGTLEGGDDIEIEETAATLSVPQQQGASGAGEANVISSVDDEAISRLVGFAEISGKRNSLNRKANPHPRPRSQMSQATNENASIEVDIENLKSDCI
jgi:hypothetical protein